jgi:curved DNA-binding protein CbpA
MEPWSILDIDPTKDISVIKKAYAKKLKIHHPEDDPKGYQKLREAYDAALKYAKRLLKNEESEAFDIPDLHIPLTETYSPTHLEPIDSQASNVPSVEEQNAKFIEQIESLYNDFFSRINIDNWINLLGNDIFWVISNKRTISRLTLNFLSEHHYLPQDIWILLENNFNWCNEKNTKHQPYHDDFISYIEKQISSPNPLNYFFSEAFKEVDYEQFLELRERAQTSLLEDNFTDAKQYIEAAKNIYTEDSDLFRLEGEMNLSSGNPEGAIVSFNKVLTLNPKDNNSILYRATAYYEAKQIEAALEDYKHIYSKTPEENEIFLFIANSYFKLGDLFKTKAWVLKSLEIDHFNNEAKLLYAQLQIKLRKKLTMELEKDPSNQELKDKLDAINSEICKTNIKPNSKASKTRDPINKITFIKNFIKIILALIALIFFIGLVIVSKVGIVLLPYFIVKGLMSKKKK